MREILFRGKRLDNGEWVYGYPVGWQNEGGDISIVDSRFGACIDESGNLMMLEAPFVTKVDPSTVGQYTGLTEKNGKKVFEGDVVRRGYENANGSFYDNMPVSYSVNYGGWLTGCYERLTPKTVQRESVEVIGNVHDNPELLGGAE